MHDVYFRLELGNAPTELLSAQLLRPGGDVLQSVPLALQGAPRAPFALGHLRVDLDEPGRWLMRIDGLLDASLDVVASVRNRPPNPLEQVDLSPAAPSANEVVFCVVHTSLGTRTPTTTSFATATAGSSTADRSAQ